MTFALSLEGCDIGPDKVAGPPWAPVPFSCYSAPKVTLGSVESTIRCCQDK